MDGSCSWIILRAMRLGRDNMIAGRPAKAVRDYLRRVSGRNSYDWYDAAGEQELSVSRAEVVAFHKKLARLKYIKRVVDRWPDARLGGRWELTISGASLCMASATPPMSRSKAEQLLHEFLERVREVNRNPKYLYRVSRLGVFGSYVSKSADLADLDIVCDLAPKLDDKDAFMECRQAHSRAAERNGRRFSNFLDFLAWPETEVRRFLKGRRKISLHGWDEIKALKKLGAKYRELEIPG
jgi:hypothetical protein